MADFIEYELLSPSLRGSDQRSISSLFALPPEDLEKSIPLSLIAGIYYEAIRYFKSAVNSMFS